MKTGDLITICCNGKTLRGVVQLASENNRSLMVAFDGTLAFHYGQMPVLMDARGDYRSILTDDIVTIAPRKDP